MNTSSVQTAEQPGFEHKNAVLLPGKDESREPDAYWNLEEIEEPDVWALDSFTDLLPHELA